MKACTKCKIEQDFDQFNKDKSRKDGLANRCKLCLKEYKRQYYLDNKERIDAKNKQHAKDNPKMANVRNYKYRTRNLEKFRTSENKRKRRQYKENPEIFEIRRKRYIERYPEEKIRRALRIRLLQAVKSNQKSGSAVRDLGCSIDEFKSYLESKFQPGMTWNNHGKWHIDHIIPLSKFDLTKRKELLKACHFTNMQPLWAFDNLIKGAA